MRAAAPLVALGLLLGAAVSAGAQVNTERLRRDSLPLGLSGSVDGSLSLHSGNVDFTLVELGGRLDHSGRRATTFLVGRGDLGFQDGERFTRSGMLHLRYVHAPKAKVALEVFGQIDHDRARRLSFRGLAGTGPRVRIVDRQRVRVHVAAGYMFEHERLDLLPEDEHPDRTSHHRVTSYTTARLDLGSAGAASLTVYVQPRLDAMGDVRVLTDARLAVGLTDRLSLTVAYDLRHDSRPPAGVAQSDATLRTGLAVTLGGGGSP